MWLIQNLFGSQNLDTDEMLPAGMLTLRDHPLALLQ